MSTLNIGTPINLPNLLETRMLIQANSGGGKSWLARALMEEANGKAPFIVIDRDGEYYSIKEKYPDVLVIGGQFADVPITLKSAKLLPKEIISNRLSVVIDLSDLSSADKRLYVKYFLESMMGLTKEYWTAYLVFIEEAHWFCGEQDKYESGPAVKELMSGGRKKGYCGILITQRIAKLHKDAAAEANNKFIGRTFMDIDMDRAARELGFSSSKDRLLLRDLQPGEFYVLGTSITPHHPHIVKIKLPETKHPKAGNVIGLKTQKPTEKIKNMLAKLNELPAEAEKELKTIQQLQQEVNRLKHELNKATKSGNTGSVPGTTSEKDANQIAALKNKISELQHQLKETEKDLLSWKKTAVGRGVVLTRIKEIASDVSDHVPVEKTTFTGIYKKLAEEQTIVKPVQRVSEKIISSTPGALGRCSSAITQFLASYPDREWSKPQIGIAIGYSPTSSSFQNSLSELNSKGLIIRENGRARINKSINLTEWIGEVMPQNYDINTFKSKLGKCEAEIYQVVLDRPHERFTKEELAALTESNYSPKSSSYQNSLSRLNTLELIKREGGQIRLNPELLEI